MYCSVKFLSPMVMGGWPLPGWSELDGEVDEPLELDEELLSLLLPHADIAIASATASNAASGRAGSRYLRLVTVVLPLVGFLPPRSARRRNRCGRAARAAWPRAARRRTARR